MPSKFLKLIFFHKLKWMKHDFWKMEQKDNKFFGNYYLSEFVYNFSQ